MDNFPNLLLQSCKKGGSMVAMLPEGNRQDHSCQKDFGHNYMIFVIFLTDND